MLRLDVRKSASAVASRSGKGTSIEPVSVACTSGRVALCSRPGHTPLARCFSFSQGFSRAVQPGWRVTIAMACYHVTRPLQCTDVRTVPSAVLFRAAIIPWLFGFMRVLKVCSRVGAYVCACACVCVCVCVCNVDRMDRTSHASTEVVHRLHVQDDFCRLFFYFSYLSAFVFPIHCVIFEF